MRAVGRSRGAARAIGTTLLEARLQRIIAPRSAEEAELAVSLARALLAIAPDRASAEQTVAELTKAWPAELRARAKPET